MTIQAEKKIVQKLKKIRDLCTAENREPNTAEVKQANTLLDGLAASESIQDMWTLPAQEKTPVGSDFPHRSGNHADGYTMRSSADKKDYRSLFGSQNRFDWSPGDGMKFFQAVFSGRAHPMLSRAMTEGIPSDGGFLVPTEYSEKIHAVSLENELVMPRALVQPMKSDELKLPGVEIGDHSSNLYGGFQAAYTAELGTLTEANPKTRQMTLNAKKLTGFLTLSNELVKDMPNGEKQLLQICGKGLSWYRDKSFLKGSGAGEPLGILNSGATIEIAKETGQAASTIMYENLTKMLGSLYSGSFQNSVWVVHQSTIPQLLQLSISVGTGGSFIPVLNEKNGKFTILTRPVIFTEKTEPLGTKGDVMLCDFSQYIIGLCQGMRFDLSQHVYFTTDKLAARLIERHDGQPLWDEALTLEDGSTEVSPFVVLAERS